MGTSVSFWTSQAREINVKFIAVVCGPWMLWMRLNPKISNIFLKYIDFEISGGSLNFQINFRYFKYFYKIHFCFEKYIGSRNEIKLLHSFKGQFNRRVLIEGLSPCLVCLPVQACQRQVQTSFGQIKIVLAEELLKMIRKYLVGLIHF